MTNRARVLVVAAGLATVFVAVSATAWQLTRPAAVRGRLAGNWEGAGWLEGTAGETGNVKPTTAGCNVLAEFHADGTYAWDEDIAAGGFRLRISGPQEGHTMHFEVVRVRWNTVTVKFISGPPAQHGEATLVFSGNDSFTFTQPPTPDRSGTLTFNRVVSRP